MANLSINLLPPELEGVKKARAKSALIVKLSIGFLVAVIAIALVVLSVRIAQNTSLSKLDKSVKDTTANLGSSKYRIKEGLASSLVSRLGSINTSMKKEYPSSSVYGYITNMLPAGITLTTLSSDKMGKIVMTVDSVDTANLSQFLNNLVDPNLNEGRISSIQITSLQQKVNRVIEVDITANLSNPKEKNI